MKQMNGRRGAALVMVFVLGIGVLLLILAVMAFAYSSLTFTASRTDYINSLMVAESALNHGMRLMHQDPDLLAEPIDEEFPYDGQELIVWLRDSALGYTDGDMKMILQDPDYVIGVGTDQKYTRVVRARYVDLTFDSSPAALYVDAPSGTGKYLGNAFEINGNDHDVDGNPVAGNEGPGILTTSDDATDGLTPSGHQQQDNITGSTPDPSIETDTSVPVDINALSESIESFADEVITGDTKIAGNMTFGSEDDPAIVVIDGDLEVTGCVEGWGILIVKGDFHGHGTFCWHGLLIVDGGDVTSAEGNGTPDVIGAMWIKGRTEVDLEIRGNPGILYSTEALALFASIGPVIDRSSWEEL